ncbi:MAG: hypothetical protein WC359_14910 [Dehalococcoidia bacterium]|jgi:hypothetical protein
MTQYFESGTTHRLNVEAFNPTAYSWKYRFDIILEGQVVGSIEREIDTGVTKLLSTDIVMPEVSEPTELTFQVHAYEISASPAYDLGIVASTSVIVQELPSGGAYNAEAYFDDVRLANYEFEAGTAHKITVKFTNPFDTPLEFYLVGQLGGMNLFNQIGFFTVGAGQTVTKEANFLTGETLGLVGPVPISLHCTTKGIPGEDFETGSVQIIASTAVQDGTIEVVPVQTSVPQGASFEYDVRITNTTRKVWSYPFKVYLYDKNGEVIGGVSTSIGVGPYSTGVFEWATSMIKDWGVPPAGTATIKTVFLGRTETQGTFTITAATVPAAKVAYVSKTWFRIPEQNNTLMMRVNLKNNSGRTLTPWDFDGYIWSTHRAEGYVFESGLSPDGWDGDWPAGTTKPFLSEWWNMGFNPGVYDVILGLKTYEEGTWTLNGMSYPVSLGSYTVT